MKLQVSAKRALNQAECNFDLLPINRTIYFSKESIDPENDGHENKRKPAALKLSVNTQRSSQSDSQHRSKGRSLLTAYYGMVFQSTPPHEGRPGHGDLTLSG